MLRYSRARGRVDRFPGEDFELDAGGAGAGALVVSSMRAAVPLRSAANPTGAL
jgi:hypothetical protein